MAWFDVYDKDLVEALADLLDPMEPMEELFVQIEGFPNYVVSNYGRVINCVRNYDIQPSCNSVKHMKVNLYSNGIRYTKQVHQLVAQAFFVNWELGLEVLHISGDYNDNSVRNLELGTYVWQ